MDTQTMVRTAHLAPAKLLPRFMEPNMLKALYGTLAIIFILSGDSFARVDDIHIDQQVYTALESNPTVAVWIFLKDKNTSDQVLALEQLKNTYNPRAIARRIKRRTSPGLFDERDLPLAETYVATVAEHVQQIRVRSRWLNAVSADITADQLTADCQASVCEFDPNCEAKQRYRTAGRTRIGNWGSSLGPGSFYGASYDQLQLSNCHRFTSKALPGKGLSLVCWIQVSNAPTWHLRILTIP